MFIEDLIVYTVKSGISVSSFDLKILTSFHNQILLGSNFTKKQGNLAVAILDRYKKKISAALSKDISPFLDTPTFKNQFRVVATNKTITIIDHPTYKRAIKVAFPYDEQLLTKFRQEKGKLNYAMWNGEDKTWIFSLDERSMAFLAPLIYEFGFTADDEFTSYIEQIKNIQENIEKFVPMVVKKNNEYCIINVPSEISQNLGNNLISALFKARNFGIFTWDEEIEQELSTINDNDLVVKFLKTLPNGKFEINLEEKPLISIKTIINNLLPCMVVVPGGSELNKVEKSFNFFKEIGVKETDMSVMFRLSNESDSDFNQFVRNNKINNPLTPTTSVVFLSNNVPKTVLEAKISFNCVLNFNFYSPHYKLRDFIISNHNVIDIIEVSKQRRLNFASM